MPSGQEGQWKQQIWNNAWRYGAGFIKSLGINPRIEATDLSYDQAVSLGQAIRARQVAEKLPEARQRLPIERERWMEEWAVPESERAGWEAYPLTVETWGLGEGGYGEKERRAIVSTGGVEPPTIGHELAHAAYYEQMPEAMRKIYPLAHQFAQRVSSEYREAVGKYPEGEGFLPKEGYPTAYEYLGKEPERMPWYMEPFYGNLMYEVPDLPGDWERNWASYLGYWLKSKLGKESTKVKENWRETLAKLTRR